MIGNYERGDNSPSTEMLLKLAKALDVSPDYLVGEGKLANYDKDILRCIEDIELLDKDTKDKLFLLIDDVIQNFKTKQAFY